MVRQAVLGAIASVVLFFFSASFASAATPPAYKDGQLIVRFKDPSAKQMRQLSKPLSKRALRNVIANVILRGSSVSNDFDAAAPGLSVVKLPRGKKVANVIAKFDLSSAVIYAEPDYYRSILIAPNDPMYKPSQWALNNTGQASGTAGDDIDAEKAWAIRTDASNVVVAVIDTGIDVNHPDVNTAIWTNSKEVAGNKIDDDGNGYIDDVKGWDFIGDDANKPTPDNDAMDTDGHGTHVAGIIGAIGNNATGISGVCWKAKLMALKVADKNGIGFLTSGVVSAINYAVNNGAKVINASYGGYSYSVAEYDAINYARQHNVIFVAAAGNGYPNNSGIPNNNDSNPAYPASYDLDNIISVMATNNRDAAAPYTNYGARSVDLAAPGGDMSSSDGGGILSTYPVAKGGYATEQGTSMAAPHVAGAAALLLAGDPNTDYRKTVTYILKSVDAVPGLNGKCVSGGRLNLYTALKMSLPGKVALWHGATKTFKATIQAAINAAAAGDIVIAEPNHWYFETINLPDSFDITVRSGDVNTPANATLYMDTTIISGRLDDTNAVVTIDNSRTSATVLKGFTIRDGSNGGIVIDGSSPTISDCNITANSNSGSGGGVVCDASSDPNFSRCTISNNTSSGDGGGMYCTSTSLPVIGLCTISGNSSSGNGGGIFLDGGSDAEIDDCNIINNTSSGIGGGIYCTASLPVISGGAIRGNNSAWEGGGVYLDTSLATITDCNVSNNISQWDGGGIYCAAGSDALIQNSTISGNTASYDCGGIYCYNASPVILNNLFVGNTVESWDGGAVFCNTGSPSISNCTFVNNSGNAYDGLGGAIFCTVNSDPAITDCIFKANKGYAVYKSDSDSEPLITYCLFYQNPSGDYYDGPAATLYNVSGTPNPLGGAGNIGGDPMFVTGRLGNYYLSSGAAGQILDPNGKVGDANSPALDAGSDTAANLFMDTYSTRTDVVTDSGTVDMGFHYNDPQPAATYTLTIIPTPTAGGTVTPASGNTYTQFSQVQLKATPAATYQLKSWSGTDNDASTDLNNIVTMSRAKTVRVTFQTTLVELRVATNGAGGFSLSPAGTLVGRKVMYPRGTVVTVTTTPANLSYIVHWSGTDNDNSISRTNKVTIDGKTAQFNNGVQIVNITFYAPRTLHVPGDYTSIQVAIGATNPGDIVMISPGTYIATENQNGDSTVIDVSSDITLTSTNPDDPVVVAGTKILAGFDINPGVTRNMIISGLTIEGHYAGVNGCNGLDTNPPCNNPNVDGQNGSVITGGGMNLYGDASPTVINCVFTNCTVVAGNGGNGAAIGGDGGWGGWARGGAVNVDVDGNPLFKKCQFSNCRATGGNGGDGSLPGDGGSWGLEDSSQWHWADGRGANGGYLPYWKYSGYGGAVYCDSGSTPEFVDCNFVNNHAIGGTAGVGFFPTQHFKIDSFGGAVYCASNSNPKFTGCNFTGNQADANATPAVDDPYISYGGAVAYEDNATPTFENCTFSGNFATIGGAVYGEWAEGRFGDCNIVDNSAYLGGAAYFVGGTDKVEASIIAGNEATFGISEGGGIFIFDANVMIADCNINGNTSTASGGGIYIAGSNTPLIKNCLIVNNTANRDGGGISANWYAHPTITNCTIAGNSASGTGFANGYGGGMYVSYGSYAQIINSILWGNSDTTGKSGQIAIGTGFEYDKRPADVNVMYSDVQGGAAGVYFDPGVLTSKLHWDYTSNLVGLDPKFVQGYYLSQPATKVAAQVTKGLSPCVDKGKGNMAADVNTLHLYRGTTRTDRVIDTGTVDMGYHYLRHADIVGDYNFDGEVNSVDLAMFMQQWLYTNCDFPYWCDDRDLNQDGTVDILDRGIFDENYGDVETTPPNPNPMTWETRPYLFAATTVKMKATTAVDNSGFPVQYYFQRTNATGVPDGTIRDWSSDPNWTNTIAAGTTYGYRVKARDVKSDPNKDAETAWSLIAYVTGGGTADISPPTGLTLTTSNVTATGFTLTAGASDASPPITYEFTCTAGGGPNRTFGSGTFVVTGLTNNTSYTYKMRAKDSLGNTSGYSSSITVMTSSSGGGVDTTPPTPNPLNWVIAPREIVVGSSHVHAMQCGDASDVSTPVMYKFVCVDYSGVSSGWQTSTTYSVNVGGTHYYRWYAIAKDAAGNTTGTGNTVWVIR